MISFRFCLIVCYVVFMNANFYGLLGSTFVESLPVDLWLWIVSQVIGIVGVVIFMISMQEKNQERLIKWLVLSNFLTFVSLLFLFNWPIAAIMGINTFKNISFYYKHKKKPPMWFAIFILVFFIAANSVAVALTWIHYIDFAILASIIFLNYATWKKGGLHLIKGGFFVSSVLMIINAVFFVNIMGAVSAGLVAISVVLFYIKFFKNKKNKKSESEKVEEVLDASSEEA